MQTGKTLTRLKVKKRRNCCMEKSIIRVFFFSVWIQIVLLKKRVFFVNKCVDGTFRLMLIKHM